MYTSDAITTTLLEDKYVEALFLFPMHKKFPPLEDSPGLSVIHPIFNFGFTPHI